MSPSELGTYLSAGLCGGCGSGAVLPTDQADTLWSCDSCAAQVEGATILDSVAKLEAEMMDTMETEYDKYNDIIERYSKLLHPHHYQLLLCKRYLAGSIRGNITIELLERRVSLMMEFIDVFKIVDPGLTKWRGKMLYQVYKTKMFLCDIRHSKNEISKDEFVAEVERNIAGMEEVVECLQHEPETSNERRMCDAARVTVDQARDIIAMVSSLGL